MSLRVLQIAGDARFVSLSSPGLRRFGVPDGGPFDRESFLWACKFARSARAVEIGPFGGIFQAAADCTVALVGASRPISVGGTGGVIQLANGTTLQIGLPTQGARSYLACCGDPSISDAPVQRGDVLFAEQATDRPENFAWSKSTGAIRILEGPDSTAEAIDFLTQEPWNVSALSNRVGVRLEGPATWGVTMDGERTSRPQAAGTIQSTTGGTPIIIGPDGPTIGGYPRIAAVIEADLDRVGQLMPGEAVRFEVVSLEKAMKARFEHRARLNAINPSLFPL